MKSRIAILGVIVAFFFFYRLADSDRTAKIS